MKNALAVWVPVVKANATLEARERYHREMKKRGSPTHEMTRAAHLAVALKE